MAGPWQSRLWLTLILAGYIGITLAYGIVNPLFEAPDEHWHYFTVQYIQDKRALPYVADPPDAWMAQEAAQPPLYYVLAAFMITPLNTDNGREQLWLNPFFYAGDASRLTDVNRAIHTAAEKWPWQGIWLAAHLLRAFSTALGLGTLLCIYGCGRLLWPQKRENALLATALIAFLPQFNFVHASISNDPLVIFLCSLALWQLLWLWFHHDTWPRLLLLGVTCGLAALTKNAGLLLLVYGVAVLFLRAWQPFASGKPTGGLALAKQAAWRWLWRTAVFVILPTLLIAGWLWARNQQLYGDFTATEPFIRLADGDRAYTLVQVLGESGGLARSTFAVFGWFNLLAPTWLYLVWGGVVATAVLGILRSVICHWSLVIRPLYPSPTDSRSGITALWLAAWPGLVYTGLVLFMLRTPAAQGRLLFPAIVPLALGLAYGLTRWRWRGIYWLPPLLALLTTLYSCFFVIYPAYAFPPAVAALPADAALLNAASGDGLTLHAVTQDADTAVPGDTLWFTFYWSADPVPAAPPELVVELFGRDLALAGKSHTYHGRGLYPASLWPAAELIADRVGIRITETVAAPVLARVFVRLVGPEVEGEGIQVGEVKITPTIWPVVQEAALAQISDWGEVTAVSLSTNQARPGDTLKIDIMWKVLKPPDMNLTTLIHLAEAGQPPLATGDNQPLNGQYPTRAWAAAERIVDSYTLILPADLPDGRYPLWLGLYDANSPTFERQPLSINGERQPGDVLRIGYVNVGE